jgi:3-deoxy-D-manno-octulosonic-acid transferase
VVIADTVGELASMYSLSDLVFAGGTLANVGGHNLFEPVEAGKVVVHGPHTQNQRNQVRILQPLGVLHPVDDARALRQTLQALWNDPERNAPAHRARSLLSAHRGAAKRALALILDAGAPGA